MHTAYYYQELEKKKGAGQGDIGEGSIFPGLCMYKYSHYPIYCLSLVESSKDSSMIVFDDRIIKDFDCENGFLVLIEYEPFLVILGETMRDGTCIRHGRVRYGVQTTALSLQLLAKSVIDNLFIKRPMFQYQNEYRIVVCKDYIEEEFSLCEAGQEFHIVYNLSKNLRDIAKKICISSMSIKDNKYTIVI